MCNSSLLRVSFLDADVPAIKVQFCPQIEQYSHFEWSEEIKGFHVIKISVIVNIFNLPVCAFGGRLLGRVA